MQQKNAADMIVRSVFYYSNILNLISQLLIIIIIFSPIIAKQKRTIFEKAPFEVSFFVDIADHHKVRLFGFQKQYFFLNYVLRYAHDILTGSQKFARRQRFRTFGVKANKIKYLDKSIQAQ